MTQQIDTSLAIALAGQVSAGLAVGDGQEERARAALTAIGLMLYNATEEQMVRDSLNLAGNVRVTSTGPGTWRFDAGEDEGTG